MKKTITITASALSLWLVAAVVGLGWTKINAQQPFSIVPAGLINFSTQGTCPSGWTEYTAARGLYIVRLPSGGTITSVVGTALTAVSGHGENRAVGQHNHGLSANSHTHTLATDSHFHGGAATTTVSTTDPFSFTANYVADFTGFTNFATTGITLGQSTTGLAVSNTGTTAGTNAPYIEDIACIKS